MTDRPSQHQWRRLEARHHARVDAATAAHQGRWQNPRRHPVEDPLFSYHRLSPAQ